MSEPTGYLAEVFTGFQGEGTWAGYRQIFLRLAGCRETCAYCDTPQSRIRKPQWKFRQPGSATYRRWPNPVSVGTLLAFLGKLHSEHGPFHSLAVTGGEPLEQADFVKALLLELRRRLPQLRILLETNGRHAQALQAVLPAVDFVAMDLKLQSTTGQPTPWQAHRCFLAALGKKPGCAKVVVSPHTPATEISRAAKLLQRLKPQWDLVIQPESRRTWSVKNKKHLDQLAQTAARMNTGVRMLPQMHYYFGME